MLNDRSKATNMQQLYILILDATAGDLVRQMSNEASCELMQFVGMDERIYELTLRVISGAQIILITFPVGMTGRSRSIIQNFV